VPVPSEDALAPLALMKRLKMMASPERPPQQQQQRA
jgi:hypothetical protein